MQLTVHDIARMTELSAVRTDVDLAEVRRLADHAKKLRCVIAYVLPCYMTHLKALLEDTPEVGLGGTVGFPSGAHTTGVKVAETRQCLADGAVELDMVVNVGMLRSGQVDYVEDDVRQVVDAAEGTPLKVILECHYLNDDQIRQGSEICLRAGAAYVKTGSGWAETGATLHNVTLIKSVVGDRLAVKASGGIRDLETLVQMYRRGARRFGIGLAAGVKILEQCAALPGGVVEV